MGRFDKADVVVVVAEARATPCPHGGGVRVGRAHPPVRGAAVAPAGRPVRGQPPLLQELSGALRREPRRREAEQRLRRRRVGIRRRPVRRVRRPRVVREEVRDVGVGLGLEARTERGDGGVGLDLGRVEEELPAPDQAGLEAHVDDLLEEVLEDLHAQPLPDAGQAGVVRQILV